MATILTVAEINETLAARGVSAAEFWSLAMDGDRADLPASDVERLIAELGAESSEAAETYEVVTYDADGHQTQERKIKGGLSLDAAKQLADKGYGSWRPDGEGEVIAYHESAEEGCGGRLVRREV